MVIIGSILLLLLLYALFKTRTIDTESKKSNVKYKQIKIALENCNILRSDIMYVDRKPLEKTFSIKNNYNIGAYSIEVKIDNESYFSSPIEMTKEDIKYFIKQNGGVDVRIYENGLTEVGLWSN